MKKKFIASLAFVSLWAVVVFSSVSFASTSITRSKFNWSGDRKPFFSGNILSGDHKKPISWTKIKVDTGMEITTELTNAISWMYENNLTSYSGVAWFKPNNYVTREQASKFFVLFAKNILGKTGAKIKEAVFSDVSGADKTLQSYIKEAAKMGLLKWSKGKFGPFNKLTQAQAVTILIRALDGAQTETGAKWYSEYYTIASNYGLLEGLNFDSSKLDTTSIKRWELTLLLYRVVTKYLIH